MEDINRIIGSHAADKGRIIANNQEKEYSVLGYKDVPVPVPYSDLSDAKKQRDALVRLLRKSVPEGTILAFIEQAEKDGRWE